MNARFLILLGILSWLVLPLAAQSGTGTLEGRVFNAATGAALANARVTIAGTGREAITDAEGGYRLTQVPAGPVRLDVFYLGFERQEVAVNVSPGVTQRYIDLVRTGTAAAGDTVQLQAFSVVADREMSAQAIAMNEQRQAPNIKSVVAIDEYGDRGDENIGEFMRFLPGVALNDSGTVPNEVTLRGFPSNNSGLLIDGGEIAGARSGNTRALSLLEVPMSNVSRVEITKVPTPDMPASGLGGSINIISKRGFESKRPRLDFQLYQLFHSRTGITLDGGPRTHVSALSPKWVQPSLNFSYLHPVNKNFAFTVGGARTWRQKPMERDDDADETAEWNLVSGFQRQSEWQSLSQILATWTGQAGADWKISPHDTLSAGIQYRETTSYITRSNLVLAYGAGATGNASFTQGAATGVGTATQGDGANQDIDTATTHVTLKYARKTDLWRIEASGAWSKAEAGVQDIDRGHFNTSPANIVNLVIRGDAIGARGGIIPTRYSAVTRTGAPVDLYNGANYSLVSGTSAQTDNRNDKKTGRLDVARDLALIAPVTIKVGVAVDRQDKDLRTFSKTWNFRPNGATDATARLAGNFPVFDEAFIADAPTIYGTPMRWISQQKVFQLFQQRPEWFVLDEPLAHQNLVTNSRKLIETISSAYLRTDWRLLKNRLWIVAGVRFEQTEAEGWGALNDPAAQYQRDAAGNIVRNAAGLPVTVSADPLVLRRLRFVERGTHATRKYDGYYPSLNASYNISDHLVARAAYARTIGRPNLSLIIPGATFSEPTVAAPSISVTNAGLKPWTADSYDLSLESYHLKDGFGSVGVFQKNIKDFFGATSARATPQLLELYGLPDDPLYLNYDINTTTNVGDAKVTGVEFTYRQSLTFLPDWARGFQVFLNGSRMTLTGSNTADFTGFNPSSYAGGINFIRNRYFIKVTCTHQGETRRGAVAANAANGIPANTYNYQSERTRWGVSAQYSLTKRFALFGSMTDINDGFNPLNRRYAPDTPEYARGQRLQNLGSAITLGVKGTF